MFTSIRLSCRLRLIASRPLLTHRRFYCLTRNHAPFKVIPAIQPQNRRFLSTVEAENIQVSHSRFLSEASPNQPWTEDGDKQGGGDKGEDAYGEDDSLPDGKGKLSPTSSHLFKLIIPLHLIHSPESREAPTVFLLHPSQPLAHVSRLILSSLPIHIIEHSRNISISFESKTPRGNNFQWSESTDVGDFIRDAARSAEFEIKIRNIPSSTISSSPKPSTASTHDHDAKEVSTADTTTLTIPVTVPTFASRTRFLRRRLSTIEAELTEMGKLKQECDREARRGARRMAVTGFGVLVVYWGAVARLTFWDYGWDVMEPITYLSGLSTVILGYLWFLYQGREVSYTSVLSRSISARQEALYKARGFDIDRWQDLMEEKRRLRKEIERIRGEYDVGAKRDEQERKEGKESREGKDDTEHGLNMGEQRERDEEEREIRKRGV
ncbi:hypothetical protein K474DRAFT_183560 [Panus rudis PR-1116 ss-1]|nr:hypothetical protein K474DRAFT_183560 [Panus rudis PR-1116 ss-1]